MRRALAGIGLCLMSCSPSPTSVSVGGPTVSAVPPPTAITVVNCNADSDCMGDICNTDGHVCMHQCSTPSDCATTENASCSIVPSAFGSGSATDQTVCQCSSSTCGAGTTCSPLDLICETSCTQDSECSGFVMARFCQSGACVVSSFDSDGGASPCSISMPCPSGQVCELTQGVCSAPANPGAECSSVDPLPDVSPVGPVIRSVVADGNTRTDPGCVSNGAPGTVVEYLGSYVASAAGEPTAAIEDGGAYGLVEWVAQDGSIPGGGPNTYARVKVTPDTFSFELCDPQSSVQTGVVLLDRLGELSNVACIPDWD